MCLDRLDILLYFPLFNDQRIDTLNLSLASPASSGIAARLRGDFGVYGVIDQQIYRPLGGDAESGIAVFSRISASPSDRNLVDFYVDGGIVFSGMIAGRPNDKFGANAKWCVAIRPHGKSLVPRTRTLTRMGAPRRETVRSNLFHRDCAPSAIRRLRMGLPGVSDSAAERIAWVSIP